MSQDWTTLPFWDEWGSITRIHGSALIAFKHSEISIRVLEPIPEVLTYSKLGSDFETNTNDHINRILDAGELHQMALFRYFAATESFARFALYIRQPNNLELVLRPLKGEELDCIEKIHLIGGIEAWSEQVIEYVEQDWKSIYGGKQGLLEISILRNAIAHGIKNISADIILSAKNRGVNLPFSEGERVAISFELLNEYRGRLRSFCRAISDGLVHQSKGTHQNSSSAK